jgi:hypothetical protein
VEAEGQAEKQLGQEVARELSEVQLERVSEAEQSAMHLESVLDDLAAAKVTLERADESEGIALRQLAEFKQTSAEQIDKLTQALQKVTSDVRRSKLKREELLKLSLAEGPLEEAQEILDLKQQLQELSETKVAIRQLPALLAQAQAAHDVRGICVLASLLICVLASVLICVLLCVPLIEAQAAHDLRRFSCRVYV